jgi:tetratricopeptide (TPR) repeat protein
LVGGAGTASAQAELPGTEAFNTIDSVVVVYPSGPGEDVEINRLSGQRRAGFLKNLLGVDAEYAADDEVTETQRSKHLLLLGWNNRLLGTEQAPSLFERSDEGGTFLGSVSIGPGEDLMLSTASPYNDERRLFFWSRIDLELDKFSVLPFLGSDWAVYRGYEVVRQGMFLDRAAWPPQRNLYAEAEHPDFRKAFTEHGESEHYTIHYRPGGLSEKEHQAVLEARERALSLAIAGLGDPGDGFRIELYVFTDADDKEALTGVPDPVHSLGRPLELHMQRQHAHSDNPHEEIHLLAQYRFGPCHHTALHEGLAMAFERPASGSELAVYAAALVAQDAVPSLAELLDEEGVRVLNQRGLGFPAAGMMVSWILEQGSTSVLSKVYSSEPLTETELARAVSLAPEQANASYAKWVGALAAKGESEYRFREARAEARRFAQVEAWAAAVQQLTAALELRPGDMETLYRLALVEVRADLLAPAETHLRRILAAESEIAPTDQRLVIFANYHLAQLLERSDRPEEAKKHYLRMLEYPDRHDSHRMAREALAGEPAGGGR